MIFLSLSLVFWNNRFKQRMLDATSIARLSEAFTVDEVLESGDPNDERRTTYRTTCRCRLMPTDAEEFPGGVDGRDEFVGEVLYRQLIGRRRCKRVEWRKVPHSARSSAGAREGSPGMFYQNGFIFVFGGWGGRGPRRDLHVTKLDSPMEFHPVAIDGAGPYPTYEAKVTVLDDRVSGTDPLRVLVTGGWCHGGLLSSAWANFSLSLCHYVCDRST